MKITDEMLERLNSLSKVGFGYDIKDEDRAAIDAVLSALAAAEERGRMAERERCPTLELMLTRTLGARGSAFDPPVAHRAYTYEHQPHNGPAYNLGCAVSSARSMPAGDEIDVGLALLKSLHKRGFGVFETKPEAITKEPTHTDPQRNNYVERYDGID